MAISLPNGATVSIAATYGTVKAITAITNATQAVATLEATHAIVVNDVMEVTSGWSRLNGRIVRASALATNDVTLEKINTTSTTRFPLGSGTGSVREILTWQQIIQVLETSSAGGDQQFATYSFLEDSTDRQLPTNKSAQSLTLQIGDDATLPHYAVLDAADDDRLPRAIRIQLPNGGILFYNCIVSLNKTPTLTKNQVMSLAVTLSLQADPTRY